MVSGLVPLLNAELIVAGAAVAVPPSQRPLAVLVCSVGQTLSKVGLYIGARWLPQRLPKRARKKLEQASEKVRRVEKGGWSLILVSSVVGIPPFYVVSLAAGATRVNLAVFTVLGLVGRIVRFAIIAYSAGTASDALEMGP